MSQSFRLPQRIPLAVAVTVALQTGAGLIWAGAAEQRLNEVERITQSHESAPERLARVEEQVIAVRAQLQRIENKLDALTLKGGRDD